jgi:hypothetical protein
MPLRISRGTDSAPLVTREITMRIGEYKKRRILGSKTSVLEGLNSPFRTTALVPGGGGKAHVYFPATFRHSSTHLYFSASFRRSANDYFLEGIRWTAQRITSYNE